MGESQKSDIHYLVSRSGKSYESTDLRDTSKDWSKSHCCFVIFARVYGAWHRGKKKKKSAKEEKIERGALFNNLPSVFSSSVENETASSQQGLRYWRFDTSPCQRKDDIREAWDFVWYTIPIHFGGRLIFEGNKRGKLKTNVLLQVSVVCLRDICLCLRRGDDHCVSVMLQIGPFRLVRI